MSLLRNLFGPSKDEIWSQIAKDIGGEFIDRGFWKNDQLRYQHGEWELVLDTFSRSNGNNSSTTYTRMRAPFINKDKLYFKIYRENIFSSIGKFFGMQDIEIGSDFFDDNFIIKGNNPQKIKELLRSSALRNYFNRQPRVMVKIQDNDSNVFRNHFPHGVDQLYFECMGIITNKADLHNLFKLFTELLDRLVAIDSAYEDDPNITLK